MTAKDRSGSARVVLVRRVHRNSRRSDARLREAPFTSEFRRDMTFFERTAWPRYTGQEQKRKFDRAFSLGPIGDLIAGHKVALKRHFAAEILRGPPSAMMARVLRDESARRSELREFQLSLPFAAAAARLLPGASQGWLESSASSAERRYRRSTAAVTAGWTAPRLSALEISESWADWSSSHLRGN